MKRRKLLRHLRDHQCVFVREGAGHTIVSNAAKDLQSEVPRHREVKFALVRQICKDLAIPLPAEK